MLALRTGWTPDVLAELPARFRAACHWALWVEARVGPEGFSSTEAPRGAPLEVRAAAARLSIEVARARTELFPDGDD
jgi:hypothetical protein